MNEVAIRLHVEPLDEGGYVATSPDVPGLVAEGRSIVEAVEIAQGLTRKIAESFIEQGEPLSSHNDVGPVRGSHSDEWKDPIIEFYMRDVDREALRENLKLTVEQRLEKLQRMVNEIERSQQDTTPDS